MNQDDLAWLQETCRVMDKAPLVQISRDHLKALLDAYEKGQAMKPEYEPMTLDQRLGYLTEEGGEAMAALGNLLQAVGKSQRWGIESSNPELPTEERIPNRLWILGLIAPLKVELQDLAEAVERVEVALQCNHKFVDSDRCLKCGCTVEELRRGGPDG